MDVVLVVGSENSSNSHRLREVALEQGTDACLIDDEAKLEAAWFATAESVGITAGASAPEASVQSVVQWLRARWVPLEIVPFGAEEPLRVFSLPSELQLLKPWGQHPANRG